MNIYTGPKDEELLTQVNKEAKRRSRSVSYIIKERLRAAYGITQQQNGKD